jgi:uncharacterized membrane protein SirB2
LITELEALKQQLEDAEYEAKDSAMIEMKTVFMQRAMVVFLAGITIIQSAFSAFNKPSPFTGAFAWFLIAYAVLILFAYLGQIAMHKNRKIRFTTTIKESSIKVDSVIDALKATNVA